VYIHRSRPYINQTWRHDGSYGGPDRYWALHPNTPYGSRYGRTPDARGRTTTPPKPSGGVFGYTHDAQSFSHRGGENFSAIRPRRTTTASSPGVRQGTARSAPIIRQPPPVLIPSTSPRQATPTSRTGGGISQPSSGQRKAQPIRTPSSAFGGYRGANEPEHRASAIRPAARPI